MTPTLPLRADPMPSYRGSSDVEMWGFGRFLARQELWGR